MKLHDLSVGSRPAANAAATPDASPRVDVTGLAQAYDAARRASPAQWMAPRTSTDAFSELSRAVHAFVGASRAAGIPPERVLIRMKQVARACTADVDGPRADRLKELMLHEFLATYYTVAAPMGLVRPVPE